MQPTTALAQGVRNYWTYVSGFGYNARLFLWSSLLGGLVLSINGLLFNFYLVSLGYRPDFLGVIASVTQFVTLVASLPAAMLSDAIGRKPALIAGTAASTIGLAGFVLITSPEGLIAMSVVLGIGTAVAVVVAAPFMMENSAPEERTHLFSVSFAVTAAAGFAGGYMGGNLPAWLSAWVGANAQDAAAYQAALALSAAISALSVVPLLFLRSNPDIRRRTIRPPLTGVRSEGALLFKLLFPNLLIGIGAGLLIPFANVFLRDRYGVGDAEVGTLFSLSALVAAIAIAVGPVFAQRFGTIRAVVGAQALSIPLLLLMGFSPVFLPAVIAYLVRTSLMQMSGPLFNAFAMEVVSENARATASSLFSMVWTFGWVVSPVVSGQIVLHYGWSPIIVAMALLYASGVGLTHLYFGRRSAA